MNDIIVENQIAIGLLAVVYKVVRKNDQTNTPLILKEVECQDLKYAEKAQSEYRLFHSLRHRFICTLKDSFIKWDRKLSTAFVCYVMDYFEKGDLMTLLNKYRSKKEVVPFELLENWIAFIVESVNYLQKNKIIHANIKPSSFYLKSSDDNSDDFQLLIGDYGVPTIMKDARTKTRLVSNAFDYAGPEIIDGQPYDFKSDIWSIGATLLDICTTGLYDYEEFHSHLLNIRFDNELLSNILKDIHKVYESKTLVDLIGSMLCQIEDRPSIKTIINNHFVQHCLEKIESNLVIHSGNLKHDVSHDDELPEKSSIENLIEFIIKNVSNEGLTLAGVHKLNDLVNENEFDLFEENNQFLINKLIMNYSKNQKIQNYLFNILESSLCLIAKKKLLNSESLNNKHFLNATTIKNIFYIFLKYEDLIDMQLLALKIFIHLSNFENVTNQLASYSIIKHILENFDKHSLDATFCAYISKSIWCLCQNRNILRSARNLECLSYVKKCILQHRDDLFCCEMALNAIISLSADERQICADELNVDITSAILVALECNLESASLVKSACIALAALISFLEDCAFRFLYLAPSDSNKKEIDGIVLMKKAYSMHKDELEVVECICNVFKELSTYDEMLIELKSIKINETLISEVARRFRDNLNISQTCNFVCSKVENHGKSMEKVF